MENELNKAIYKLKFNETYMAEMKWGLRTDVTRVAGGWIYQNIIRQKDGKDKYLNPCFVPYDNEFALKEKIKLPEVLK